MTGIFILPIQSQYYDKIMFSRFKRSMIFCWYRKNRKTSNILSKVLSQSSLFHILQQTNNLYEKGMIILTLRAFCDAKKSLLHFIILHWLSSLTNYLRLHLALQGLLRIILSRITLPITLRAFCYAKKSLLHLHGFVRLQRDNFLSMDGFVNIK